MRYKITCCKGCEFRAPGGCACPIFKQQRKELAETNQMRKKEIYSEVAEYTNEGIDRRAHRRARK